MTGPETRKSGGKVVGLLVLLAVFGAVLYYSPPFQGPRRLRHVLDCIVTVGEQRARQLLSSELPACLEARHSWSSYDAATAAMYYQMQGRGGLEDWIKTRW